MSGFAPPALDRDTYCRARLREAQGGDSRREVGLGTASSPSAAFARRNGSAHLRPGRGAAVRAYRARMLRIHKVTGAFSGAPFPYRRPFGRAWGAPARAPQLLRSSSTTASRLCSRILLHCVGPRVLLAGWLYHGNFVGSARSGLKPLRRRGDAALAPGLARRQEV